MAAQYSDKEIEDLIADPKALPANWRVRVQLREKRGHKERELDVVGEKGNSYRLILRQSDYNVLDFSAILAVQPDNTNQLFRLTRYNGKSHEHTNKIEETTFYDFHVHKATERYQELGGREDAYAEPTAEYQDFHTALRCLLRDCGFRSPDEELPSLFKEFEV
jgi:hypothetical protein